MESLTQSFFFGKEPESKEYGTTFTIEFSKFPGQKIALITIDRGSIDCGDWGLIESAVAKLNEKENREVLRMLYFDYDEIRLGSIVENDVGETIANLLRLDDLRPE